MWTRSLLLLCLFTCMIKSCKTVGVPFPHSISRAYIIRVLHNVTLLRTHQSSSYCYTFTSHASNLDFWFVYNFFLSFDSFYVTVQHGTIVVHENCWDSLKAPPDFFTFMWYSSSIWVITKTSPAMQDMNGTSAKTFSDIRYKILNALVIHV